MFIFQIISHPKEGYECYSITDMSREDKFSLIFFRYDKRSQWYLHSAWVVPDNQAEQFNKDYGDEGRLPYEKRNSVVFGYCYWEDCFTPFNKANAKLVERFVTFREKGSFDQLQRFCISVLNSCLYGGGAK